MTINNDNNYWKSGESQGFHDNAEQYQVPIHRRLAKVIEQYKPQTLLDYGCGRGCVAALLDSSIQKTLYDVNPDNIQIDNLEQHQCTIIRDTADLPAGHFDVVMLNFVLICIPDEKTYTDILSTIKSAKKECGKLIIVDSHPCFMQYCYSHLRSEFSEDFQYLSYGTAYTKHIHSFDSGTGETDSISFLDFHWPFSFTVNKLIECGFRIVRMEEWEDMGLDGYCAENNGRYPPTYCLICE